MENGPPPPGFNPNSISPYPPVVQQPMGMQTGPPQQQGPAWMAPVQGADPNCPPGLEYLSMVDQLLVKQKVELLEAFTGIETSNKYQVVNSMGQIVYQAVEDSNFCARQCCGKNRPFDLKIVDTYNREVIRLDRGLRCDSCCFPCCLQKMEVMAPPGTLIGTVEQSWSICVPKFAIKDADGATVLRIVGPCCTWSCCGDVEFTVESGDGTEVGKVSKQWSGLGKEMFTDADNFGISFPMDLDVRCKATVLGACFLIDFMFFEKGPGDHKRVDLPGMID